MEPGRRPAIQPGGRAQLPVPRALQAQIMRKGRGSMHVLAAGLPMPWRSAGAAAGQGPAPPHSCKPSYAQQGQALQVQLKCASGEHAELSPGARRYASAACRYQPALGDAAPPLAAPALLLLYLLIAFARRRCSGGAGRAAQSWRLRIPSVSYAAMRNEEQHGGPAAGSSQVREAWGLPRPATAKGAQAGGPLPRGGRKSAARSSSACGERSLERACLEKC